MIVLFATATQPIISVSRPGYVDPYFYSFMTMLIEFFIYIPIYLRERGKKQTIKTFQAKYSRVKIITRILIVALIFAIALPLFYLGYDLSTPITGSLMIKTSVLFSMAYGYVILREKVTKSQVLFSIIMIFGLSLTVTGGTFTGLVLNIGALLLILVPFMWTIGHGMTKPILGFLVSPNQVITIRNAVGALFMGIIYIFFFPLANFSWIFDPIVLISTIVIAISYALGHYGWYKTMIHLDLNKGTAIVAPTPILTGFLQWIVLGIPVTVFDMIGTAIVIISIIFIMQGEHSTDKNKTPSN